MDYSKITLFNMMQTKMGYLAERQDLLSNNVANIDTPGYKPRDLKELNFKKMAHNLTHKLQIRSTSPMHQSGKPIMNNNFRDSKMKHTFDSLNVSVAGAILMDRMR